MPILGRLLIRVRRGWGLDTDAEWRENVDEEPHSHFNYEWDSLTAQP
jgi:hypothetical protein